jgi:hypothetical protein
VLVGSFALSPSTASVQRVVDLSAQATPGEHTIELVWNTTDDDEQLSWQVAGRTYAPRTTVVLAPGGLNVVHTLSAQTVRAGAAVNVTTRLSTDESFEQLLVVIPLPTGFSADVSGFDSAVAAGQLASYDVEDDRIVLYALALLDEVPLTLRWQLRARLAGTTTLPATTASAYYEPARQAQSTPLVLNVTP